MRRNGTKMWGHSLVISRSKMPANCDTLFVTSVPPFGDGGECAMLLNSLLEDGGYDLKNLRITNGMLVFVLRLLGMQRIGLSIPWMTSSGKAPHACVQLVLCMARASLL